MGANGEIMEPTFVRMDFEYPEGLNDTLVLKKDKCKVNLPCFGDARDDSTVPSCAVTIADKGHGQ